jgi:hypothetical protein
MIPGPAPTPFLLAALIALLAALPQIARFP